MRPHRLARNLAWLAAPALIATTTVLTVPGTASAAAATQTLKVLQWNVAGNVDHNGSTTDGLDAAIVTAIQNQGADLVSLNELCQSQYNDIISRLRMISWAADPSNFARFTPEASGRCNGSDVGNGVFSKAPLGGADKFLLTPQDASGATRYLTCVPLQTIPSPQSLVFCNTHLSTNQSGAPASINAKQVVAAHDHIVTTYPSATVLVSGDFNAQPLPSGMTNMAPFYADYTELDSADTSHCPGYGEWTTNLEPGQPQYSCGGDSQIVGHKKIDFVFAQTDKIAGSFTADVKTPYAGCGAECHRMLIGTVTTLVS
jgi:endonuclease/exonuclease/phosphatase (EEP) superfamily protein YafD